MLRDLDRREESRQIYRGVLQTQPQNSHAMLGLAAVRMDDYEHRAGDEALQEAKHLLDRLWASGNQTRAVRAA